MIPRMVRLPWLALGGSAAAFLLLALAAGGGAPGSFDEAALRALRDPADPARLRGPAWLPEVMRDLTAFGGFAALVVVAAAAAVALARAGRRRLGLVMPAAVAGGFLLSQGLKRVIARPRPAVVPHLDEVTSASFPSGHSMMAAVTYLTLAAVLHRAWPGRRTGVLPLAVILVVLVGTSRVCLGVHYPTDVLAGWAAGGAWAAAWWLVLVRRPTS